MEPTAEAIAAVLAQNAPTVAGILGGAYVLRPYIAPLALWVKDRLDARAAREAKRDAWIESLVEKFKADSDLARQEFLAALRAEQKVIAELTAAIRAGGLPHA
jgi:hypothetical protein